MIVTTITMELLAVDTEILVKSCVFYIMTTR